MVPFLRVNLYDVILTRKVVLVVFGWFLQKPLSAQKKVVVFPNPALY
jgi:hypothetical protein